MKILKIETLKILFVFMVTSIVFVSCEKDNPSEQLLKKGKDKKDLNIENDDALFERQKTVRLIKKNAHRLMDYRKEEDLKLIYSGAMHVDSIFYVSYQPANFAEKEGKWFKENINSKEWIDVKNEIIDLYSKYISNDCYTPIDGGGIGIALKSNFQFNDKMPVLKFHSSSYAFLKSLTELEGKIKFIETNNGSLLAKKSEKTLNDIGCGTCVDQTENQQNSYRSADGELISWHQLQSQINEDTWINTAGEGIGIAILDTGVDTDEPRLSSQGAFASGAVPTRTVVNKNFIKTGGGFKCVLGYMAPQPVFYDPNDFDDECGHGTKVASLIGMPRGIHNDLIFGTAYGCNIFNYRVGYNPIIYKSHEVEALCDALVELSTNDQIHIVTMSIGTLLPNAMIESVLAAAYNQGKIINIANGTSSPNTRFTSWLAGHPSANSITGITKPNSNAVALTHPVYLPDFPHPLFTDDTAHPCLDCWYGPGVDFSVIVQQRGTMHFPLLARTECDGQGPAPHQLSFQGSSVATAQFSAMAALIYSKMITGDPVADRDAVMARIRDFSSNVNDPTVEFGLGFLRVNDALSGL